jgi:hypothetical protein
MNPVAEAEIGLRNAAAYIARAGKIFDSLPSYMLVWLEEIEGTEFIEAEMAKKLNELADRLEQLDDDRKAAADLRRQNGEPA